MEFEYTKKSIRRLLENIYTLRSLAENGNMDATVTLVDLEIALEHINLTDQQKKVLFLFMVMQYTLEEIATTLDMTRQGVDGHVNRIVVKVYKYLNGEVVD